MAAMKWWGWGLEGVEFTHEDKPELGPFIKEVLGLEVGRVTSAPIHFKDLSVPEPWLPDGLRAGLEQAVTAAFVSVDLRDRVAHARGKSLRDLVRQRRGDLPRVPDVVVCPGSEDEVAAVLRAAVTFDAVVIPFGGGSSISGSLEAPATETRPVISVDLVRLDKLLAVDGLSRLARVQAGVFGPHLEEQLGAQGYTFGHFPDSFTHSTLGGWIATRSSGMQSDRYGDIADMTKGLRVVTPSGTLVTRPIPTASTGPSIREMVLGSEGRLGLITEATVHVRRIPESRAILGYLFPTFADGLAAMRDIAAGECSVSVTRVSDAYETRFSFAMRKKPTFADKLLSQATRIFLARRLRYDLREMCLSFIGVGPSASS
jgi:alkyldihydroxyacetonephosphate synthase